ncbi:NIPSNAP family protein [soil metagenome]
MIYELKKYTPYPGKGPALKARFEAVTLPIFERVGIKVLYCFEDTSDPDGLLYLTAFHDEAERDAAWKAFGADTGWKEAKAASEVDGPLLMTQVSSDLVPTSFSPSETSLAKR